MLLGGGGTGGGVGDNLQRNSFGCCRCCSGAAGAFSLTFPFPFTFPISRRVISINSRTFSMLRTNSSRVAASEVVAVELLANLFGLNSLANNVECLFASLGSSFNAGVGVAVGVSVAALSSDDSELLPGDVGSVGG